MSYFTWLKEVWQWQFQNQDSVIMLSMGKGYINHKCPSIISRCQSTDSLHYKCHVIIAIQRIKDVRKKCNRNLTCKYYSDIRIWKLNILWMYTVQKFKVSETTIFLKEVSYFHQGCMIFYIQSTLDAIIYSTHYLWPCPIFLKIGRQSLKIRVKSLCLNQRKCDDDFMFCIRMCRCV